MRRRQFLKQVAALGVMPGLPDLVFASAPTQARLVLVILRGALDGLAAAPAWGDPDYARQRGKLAIAANGAQGALKLSGEFGLHPSLQNLHRWYQADELIALHAIATPYRERSHFDGQDLLEKGTETSNQRRDGWLNRALRALADSPTSTSSGAIALAWNAPLVLRGEYPVSTWAPSRLPDPDAETLDRIAGMYAPYPAFAKRLAEGRSIGQLAEQASGETDRKGAEKNKPAAALARAAGRFLADDRGPRIAVLEYGGWDTHANQGAATGALARRLGQLDDQLAALREGLGDTWQQTAIIVTTEFGRTVAVNGTLGTDHGTGGCAFLLGGAVNGGRVIADWPGLADSSLYQGRDLRPTTDLRALLKGVLSQHLSIANAALEKSVFPDSQQVKGLRDLVSK